MLVRSACVQGRVGRGAMANCRGGLILDVVHGAFTPRLAPRHSHRELRPSPPPSPPACMRRAMSTAISRTIDSQAILPNATPPRGAARRAARRRIASALERGLPRIREQHARHAQLSLGALVVPLARVRLARAGSVAVHDERRLARPRAGVWRWRGRGRRALRGADVLPGAPDLQGPRPQDRRRRVGPRRAAHRHPRCQARRRLAAEAELLYLVPTHGNLSGASLPPSGGGSSSRWRRSTTFVVLADERVPAARLARRQAAAAALVRRGVPRALRVGRRRRRARRRRGGVRPVADAAERRGEGGATATSSASARSPRSSPGLRLGLVEAAPSLLARVAERGYLVSGGGVAPFVSEVVAEVLSSGAQNEVLDFAVRRLRGKNRAR